MSFALFTFMGVLIFQNPDFNKDESENIQISFLRNYKETQVENMERKKPEKPKDPMEAPEAPKVSVSKPQDPPPQAMQAFDQTFDASAIGAGIAVGGLTGVDSGGNNELTPLISIQCEAPRQARIDGITGNITLKYDVNTNGQVESVEVVQSNPPRVFDQNCIRALLQSKFKPKMVDGKPVAVQNLLKRFNFSYEGVSN